MTLEGYRRCDLSGPDDVEHLSCAPTSAAHSGNATAIEFVGDSADDSDARDFDALDNGHHLITELG